MPTGNSRQIMQHSPSCGDCAAITTMEGGAYRTAVVKVFELLVLRRGDVVYAADLRLDGEETLEASH